MPTFKLSELQSRFLDLLLSSGALKFGDFKTKSGRTSPYFFNTGAFDHGRILRDVARCYGELICARHPEANHLYGPAYKGITLAAAAAMELSDRTSREIAFSFNRKEAKDHGEGGLFVGRQLEPSRPVVIIEDVMTGGTSIRETMSLLSPRKIPVLGVVIGVDRQERGSGSQLAAAEVESLNGFPVTAILTIDEIVNALWVPAGASDAQKSRLGKIWIDDAMKTKIDDYRREWGRLKA
jgi:orotate phosphoribosyltransferase